MNHLSELRKFRKIIAKALVQYPLSNVSVDYIDYAENAVYKITAAEGTYLLRIHASSFRTAAAIKQELQYIALLRDDGFDLQVPLKAINDEYVTHVDGKMISILSWQLGSKKHKSIDNQHFEILGNYMAKLHSFSLNNRHKIATTHREYWTPDNLIGSNPILGSYVDLEKINGFDRGIFEAARLQTLSRLKNHQANQPEKFGMIHADLHFSNILWHEGALRPIDFDDCGMGSFLQDLSIPIISMQGDKSAHYRDVFLNNYSKTHSINQADADLIDDYILARHIAMQGWLFMRIDHPRMKKYLNQSMGETIKILKTGLR